MSTLKDEARDYQRPVFTIQTSPCPHPHNCITTSTTSPFQINNVYHILSSEPPLLNLPHHNSNPQPSLNVHPLPLPTRNLNRLAQPKQTIHSPPRATRAIECAPGRHGKSAAYDGCAGGVCERIRGVVGWRVSPCPFHHCLEHCLEIMMGWGK